MHCYALNPDASVAGISSPRPLGGLHGKPSDICDVSPLVQADSLHRTEGQGSWELVLKQESKRRSVSMSGEGSEMAGDGSLVYA